MADEPQTNSSHVLRAINWREVFPFTHIFRAFRIAVHPSKLVLGLVALLVLYAGGRIMDGVWSSKSSALRGEAAVYQDVLDNHPDADFADGLVKAHKGAEDHYASLLADNNVIADKSLREAAATTFSEEGKLKAIVMGKRAQAIDLADQAYAKGNAEADKLTDVTLKDQKKKEVADTIKAAKSLADASMFASIAEIRKTVPHGIFDEFFEYEVGQVNGVARSVLANNWLVAGGVKDRVINFFAVGPRWLWGYHTLYATLFTILFLVVWAVFGGAIARIAAVQVARDEKISVRQALRFSTSKVLSFVFAPLIPLLIVFVIGMLVAAGGLLFYIPFVGPILASIFFFLALIAGVVITLVLFGTVGGLNLMFPTIAVEGSDSFDAISRSFSYVFARPWRMVFYTAVAIGYGALTYLFVRFFVWITLAVTHFFVSKFLGGQAGYYFDWMWPEVAPFSADKLPYDINFSGLAFSESVAAFIISFWIYLLVGLVGAFAISFYFSANTIIYYLMRREVDATELEDVYVEEAEDDLVDPAPAMPAAAVPAASPATIVSTTTQMEPPATNPGV